MMANLPPRLMPSSARPTENARISSSISCHVQVCQMPRFLWRIAGRAPIATALWMRSLGSVSKLGSVESTGRSTAICRTPLPGSHLPSAGAQTKRQAALRAHPSVMNWKYRKFSEKNSHRRRSFSPIGTPILALPRENDNAIGPLAHLTIARGSRTFRGFDPIGHRAGHSTMLDQSAGISPQFSLGEDQIAVRDMARAFADDVFAPNALAWDEAKHFPVAEMRKAAELGMGGIYVSEDVGGSALSRLDAALIFEALATGCPTVAAYMSIHNMAAWMIDAYGSDEQRGRGLPRLCAMELLASYCLTEPGAGSDAAALMTRAVRDGDDYVLDGRKQFISGAGAGDLYVVTARTGGARPAGISTLVVPGDTPGLSLGANERKMGWNAQPTRAVVFEGVR